MSDKTQGAHARELVFLFYDKTGLRYENRDIVIAMRNAKKMLESGYTFDEIRDTIEYCIANPPPKGIYSFGFISYQIDKVLPEIKKQQMVIETLKPEQFNDYGLISTGNKDKLKPREVKIDTSIFE